MDKKTLTYFGIFVLIAVIIGGWFWIGEKHKQSTPSNEVTTNESSQIDTSDWVTYRNEEIGIEFLYPNDIYEIGNKDISTSNRNVLLKNKNIPSGDFGIRTLLEKTDKSFHETMADKILVWEDELEEWKKNSSHSNELISAYHSEFIDNREVVVHVKNFDSMIGNHMGVYIPVNENEILVLTSEEDHKILNRIYSSMKFLNKNN